MSMQLRGFKELDDQLKTLPNKVAGQALVRSLHAAAKPIITEARRLAPKHDGPYPKHRKDRKPGTLRRSIIARVNKAYRDGAAIFIGASKKAWYAYMVEMGHVIVTRKTTGKTRNARRQNARAAGRNVAPRPFLRPAFDSKAAEAVKVLGVRMMYEIKDAVRKGKHLPGYVSSRGRK